MLRVSSTNSTTDSGVSNSTELKQQNPNFVNPQTLLFNKSNGNDGCMDAVTVTAQTSTTSTNNSTTPTSGNNEEGGVGYLNNKYPTYSAPVKEGYSIFAGTADKNGTTTTSTVKLDLTNTSCTYNNRSYYKQKPHESSFCLSSPPSSSSSSSYFSRCEIIGDGDYIVEKALSLEYLFFCLDYKDSNEKLTERQQIAHWYNGNENRQTMDLAQLNPLKFPLFRTIFEKTYMSCSSFLLFKIKMDYPKQKSQFRNMIKFKSCKHDEDIIECKTLVYSFGNTILEHTQVVKSSWQCGNGYHHFDDFDFIRHFFNTFFNGLYGLESSKQDMKLAVNNLSVLLILRGKKLDILKCIAFEFAIDPRGIIEVYEIIDKALSDDC